MDQNMTAKQKRNQKARLRWKKHGRPRYINGKSRKNRQGTNIESGSSDHSLNPSNPLAPPSNHMTLPQPPEELISSSSSDNDSNDMKSAAVADKSAADKVVKKKRFTLADLGDLVSENVAHNSKMLKTDISAAANKGTVVVVMNQGISGTDQCSSSR